MNTSKVKQAAIEVVRTQNETLTEHDLAIAEAIEGVGEVRELVDKLETRATSKSAEMKAVRERLDKLEEALRRRTPVPPK